MVLLLIAYFHILILPVRDANGNPPRQYTVVFKKVSAVIYGGIFLH